ncbi:hypothetical protein BO78DRAFT_116104 [Aspergillus sclerotiicarbonarius CBS 121057]|uniref:Uncharacterized protein n=1 Tax=Aspergillus sclerotiicarbonarius (strain CBS 121057 / IBT 28362) TaxID=1448318 RepID=A0A319ERY9_ASPSB|nr:hypothetical protein BO78DRAFT_116104 [Aspergillus sclerotiicarbonarius CBS 121057]
MATSAHSTEPPNPTHACRQHTVTKISQGNPPCIYCAGWRSSSCHSVPFLAARIHDRLVTLSPHTFLLAPLTSDLFHPRAAAFASLCSFRLRLSDFPPPPLSPFPLDALTRWASFRHQSSCQARFLTTQLRHCFFSLLYRSTHVSILLKPPASCGYDPATYCSLTGVARLVSYAH